MFPWQFSIWFFEILTFSVQNDSHDKSVDTQDTSHNYWDDGLEDQVWSEDTHRADTDSGLGSSVGGSEVYRLAGISLLAKTRAEATPIYPKK